MASEWSAAGLDTGYVSIYPEEDHIGESDVPVRAYCPVCDAPTYRGVRYVGQLRLCVSCHTELARVTITTIIKATGTPVA